MDIRSEMLETEKMLSSGKNSRDLTGCNDIHPTASKRGGGNEQQYLSPGL